MDAVVGEMEAAELLLAEKMLLGHKAWQGLWWQGACRPHNASSSRKAAVKVPLAQELHTH